MSVGSVNIEGSDPEVRPQDDLFGHVNGQWYRTVEIAPDLPMAGAAVDLVIEAEAQVDKILRDSAAGADLAEGSPRQQIGDLYSSFMAEEQVEELGFTPLRGVLDEIAALTSTRQLAGLLGRLARSGVGGAFDVYVNTDDRRSDRYIVNVVQGGIGLPDEAYYREDSFAETRAAYVLHVAAMLRLLGDDEAAAEAAATRIMALETRLAAGHWDNVTTRDVVKTYNLTSYDELRAALPAFDLDAWLAGTGGTEEALAEVIVREPSYLPVVSAALAEVPLADWQDWLRFHVVSSLAPYLSSPFVEQNFAFFGRTLTGSPELKPRWKRAVALANQLIGEAVGETYVAEHFPPESKARMEELVGNLVEAYRRDIEQLDWMGPETRRQAMTKLSMFRSKIGYPAKWRDYSSAVIRHDDLVGNVLRLREFESDRQLAKLGKPVDRDEWFMPPQTVNAYYNPGLNEICFPAAILQSPFFDPEADAAANYGGIGAVIGHEIGHGFDDQGSQYDGDGNLVDWWTEEDRSRFQERADKLIGQYNGLEPRGLPGKKVNGALTVGENIGDLGGLQIAMQAYLISLGDTEPGPDAKHRLFTNWALCWRVRVRDELATQLLAVDPHSPAEFRANIVRNLDEYHQAYETSAGDGLWLDPVDRVRIW